MGKSGGGGVGSRNRIFFYMISEDYFLNIPEKSYKDVNNI